MTVIAFALGVIVGWLIRHTQQHPEIVERVKEKLPTRGKVTFIEPISDKEKFENANNIDDLLNG